MARKDPQAIKAINKTVLITRFKTVLCAHHYYSHDLFTAEPICQLADVASLGDNLIVVINLCMTYEGYSCAYGGFSPKVKCLLVESLFERIMSTIKEIGFVDSLFVLYDSRPVKVGTPAHVAGIHLK